MISLNKFRFIELFIILLYSAIAENSRAGTSPALASLNHILNRNDKSEHTTHLDNVVRIIIVWSEWRDLNSRPLDPQSSALPTALHPDFSLLLSCGSQLVYISMPFIKMQAFFRKFLNFFSGRIFKILLTRTGGYGIINKCLNDGHSRRFMERCPSG